MHPHNPVQADPARLLEPLPAAPAHDTPAHKADDSRLLALLLVAMGLVYLWSHFSAKGFNLGLNIVIALFMFAGLLAQGTPERYSRAMEDSARGISGISGISGIVLLFPFYGGIMGLMMGAAEGGQSLAALISHAFIQLSSAGSFPVLTFLSAGLVNIFVPSGGGQWAVQGPSMLPAGAARGVSPTITAMAIAWGDAWTNMIQPFWALPLLGSVGLDARALMGHCLMARPYSGLLITGVFYFMT